MKKPELLAPAGDMEKLKMAFLYGADAAYLAGKNFGMRAQSGNFDEKELVEAAQLAHSLGKKIYLTVNIMPHNDELEQLPEYLHLLAKAKVDAVIVSDMGVFRLVKEHIPQIPIHVSTQTSTVNWASALSWQEMGAERVVLARELSLEEIARIKNKVKLELEVFVHGAMCISYSGRCLLSSYMTGRDANRGFCPQSCRWKYHLVEEKRPGEFFPVFEDEHGTYVFNSKDLCLLDYLPALIKAGVDSFKIEGRMKSVHYVATVIGVYRQAIDSYISSPANFSVKEKWREELQKISHRPYTNGFIEGNPFADGQVYETSSYKKTHDFVGLVQGYENGFLILEQRNNVKAGQHLEVIQPDGQIFQIELAQLFDGEGTQIQAAAHPKQIFKVKYPEKIMENSMLRRKIAVE